MMPPQPHDAHKNWVVANLIIIVVFAVVFIAGVIVVVAYTASHHRSAPAHRPRPSLPAAVRLTLPRIGITAATQCEQHGTGCARALMSLMNGERSRVGVTPLWLNWPQTWGSPTCIGSIGHARHLATVGLTSATAHDQFPGDVCPPWRSIGENVGGAPGSKWSALVTIEQLMMGERHDASYCQSYANHACNILSRSYASVGIAFSYGLGNWMIVEDFKS